MEQMNLFDVIYNTFKIDKPIRLIEFFAGYGSQNLALKYLGADYKHHRICEWATKSIQAYNDLHIQDYTDYSALCNFEQVANYLFKKGISLNYNEPMTLEQIKRKGEQWCRTTYNNIIATHNLVNIQQVHGKYLDITDTESFVYLLTYSFPCQDLSLAGKGKGMAKGSGTRSGMLWEVERILNECAAIGKLPQLLVMENVTQVHNKENMPHFQEWIKALEKLGYKSYWQDLNAKDFGIPQNRDRTFMISILGDFYYEFPKKIKLKLRLKDMLEDEVDEKYYLSEKMIRYISSIGTKNFKNSNCKINLDIARPLTTEHSKRAGTTNYLCDQLPNNFDLNMQKKFESDCLDCAVEFISIPEATKKGYAEAYEGDGVYINRPHQKRGVVQKGMIQTLKTSLDVGVVVKVGNYSPSGHNAASIVDGSGIAPTVMENHGTVTAVVGSEKNIDGLRIRKLTPRECGRLMGLHDEDIDKISKNQSDSSLYHLFGDSIVVNVLMAIFEKLLITY
ncbi:MAG: DNA (cytosine-5-)-methyltransferase [Acholeplasmatales bacterium]|nr:DNA (cytosine-5-)-methyltransferase [Acholeplasmatales bacterium]